MSLGIAFSGGGVSAAISAACAWNAIVETRPSFLEPPSAKDVSISTVSGGSIGYGLWVNAKERIQFTPYQHNMTLEEFFHEDDDTLNQNESSVETLITLFPSKTHSNGTVCNQTAKRTVGEIVGDLFSPMFLKKILFSEENVECSHWWNCMVQRVFDSLCVDVLNSGYLSWLTSFAFFSRTSMFDRNYKGTLELSSAAYLDHVIVEMLSGRSEGTFQSDGSRKFQKIHAIDALSYSSAFWASNVLTNSMLNLLFSDMLIKSSSSESDVVILDGGVIDTTGIVGLLKQKKERIVAFYNNNVPLSTMSSPIAYLFGVDTTTDAMNSLKGPELTQVFSSSLYPDVIGNLTNPDVGIVQLTDVEIVENQMGIEPYVVQSLVIISNRNINGFKYQDKRVQDQLSPKWPDQFPYGISTLDANVLCSFNDYKVKEILKTRQIL